MLARYICPFTRRSAGALLASRSSMLATSVQGRKHLDTAAAVFEQMGARIDWARTLLALAELESGSTDLADAGTLRARLKQVVDLTTSLRLDADRVVAVNLSAVNLSASCSRVATGPVGGSAVAPLIQAEFALNDFSIGLLGSAFTLVYALGALPFGLWADRGVRRTVIGTGVAVWSVATLLTFALFCSSG